MLAAKFHHRALGMAVLSGLCGNAHGATITVDSLGDDPADTAALSRVPRAARLLGNPSNLFLRAPLRRRCIASCTLRDAVTAATSDAVVDGCGAGDPGADVIEIGEGTLTVTQGEIAVTTEIIVVGAGMDATTLDAGDASRLFRVTSPGNLTLLDLHLTRGTTAGRCTRRAL